MMYNKSSNGLQCHKYAKGVCEVSHFISLHLLEKMVIEAMKTAVRETSFNIIQENNGMVASHDVDYDKLIHFQELKLERARNAYQEGTDSLSEYKVSKDRIQKQIKKYQEQKLQAQAEASDIDIKKFADTVSDVIELVENPEISDELKNKALKTVLKKIVFHKPDRRVELFFHV